MARKWTWLVGDSGPAANAAAAFGTEVARARSRRLTWRLRGAADAVFTIDGADNSTVGIRELVTDLLVLCDGDRLFRGRLGPTQDTLDAAGHGATFTFGDYRARLARLGLYDDDTLTYTAVDQAAIAWGIVGSVQGNVGGNLGITDGVGSAGHATPRTITYDAGKMAAAAIDEIANLDGGFEWEIDANLALNRWLTRGTDRGIVLDLGGLAASISRSVDPSQYGNAVRVSGGPTANVETHVAADLALRPEGRWDRQVGYTDVDDQAVLADRAKWLLEAQNVVLAPESLDESQIIVPAYTVRLKRDRWLGPDHIWLGDPVTLVARSGRLNVNETYRVFDVTVTLGDGGEEDVDVTLGYPQRRVGDLEALYGRRLETLERS